MALGGYDAVIAKCTDCSNYDGCFKFRMHMMVRSVLIEMGVDMEFIRLLDKIASKVIIKMFQRNGSKIVIKTQFIRCSGDSMTSSGNSIGNVFIHEEMYIEVIEAIYLFVLGDDNIALIPRRVLHLIKSDAFLADVAANLGFDIKIDTHPPEFADFCSGLFYPVVENGRDTMVWGPKIGRLLSKTFWCSKQFPPNCDVA